MLWHRRTSARPDSWKRMLWLSFRAHNSVHSLLDVGLLFLSFLAQLTSACDSNVRRDIYTAVKIHAVDFWIMTQYGLLSVYKRFRGKNHLHLHGKICMNMEAACSSRRRYPRTRLHHVIPQKTTIWMSNAAISVLFKLLWGTESGSSH